jgi:hypothetical protein
MEQRVMADLTLQSKFFPSAFSIDLRVRRCDVHPVLQDLA